MNEGFLENLKNLKIFIFSRDIVKEYFSLKDLIENNYELNKLKKKIKYLKKCQMNEKDKKFIQDLLNEYNSNPLIVNFKTIQFELVQLLEEIKTEIER